MIPHALPGIAALWLWGTAVAPVPAEPCETGRIAAVVVDNRSIFDPTDPALDPRFARAYALANALHVATREVVIRREMLLREGDCYDRLLLDESARLLRGFDFLAQVEVAAVPQPDGSYHVVVDTQDEWSAQVDLRVGLRDRRPTFDGARLRQTNLIGTGRSLELFYMDRDVIREYGFTYATPQFARTRWDMDLTVGRSRAGTIFEHVFAYPFRGETGRWAARQGFSRQDVLFDYATDGAADDVRIVMPVRQKSGELAVVRRFGEPGRLTLLGGGFTHQQLAFPGGPALVHGRDFDNGEPPGDRLAGEVQSQREPLNNARVVLLAGQRNLRWTRRRGLDAMRGLQDVPIGAEIQIALARSLPGIRTDDDVFAAIALRYGAELGQLLVAGRVHADGRRERRRDGESSPPWEDLTSHAELLAYWRSGNGDDGRRTLALRVTAAGGWHTRTPYQLTLGGDYAVRGFPDERFPGGRRVVVSLEDRIYFGWPASEILDVGGTLFLDVGRVWPGDVPFGLDSGWRAAVGAGLRGSFPAGSRTTYRIDVAVPIDRSFDPSSLRLSVSAGEIRGLGARTPVVEPQLERSRRAGVTGELFHIPD